MGSAYAQEDEAALERISGLLRAYRAGGPLQSLADAAQVVVGHRWTYLIDGNRSRAAFEVADVLLDVGAQRSRLDVLDAGLAVADAELSRIPEHLDPASEILLRSIRGSLLAGRSYQREQLDDLVEAKRELGTATAMMPDNEHLLGQHHRAWIWMSYASVLTRYADVESTPSLTIRQAAVDALRRAVALPAARPHLRAAARHQLAMARVARAELAAGLDRRRLPELAGELDRAIGELTGLINGEFGHRTERTTWLDNRAALRRKRGDLGG